MPPVTEIKQSTPDDSKPTIPKPWKIPLLRLKVNDLACDGATTFFTNVDAPVTMKEAVVGVLEGLYTKETQPESVRSITLVLRSMGGVAYTTGAEIDDDHKEIHFSTDYIAGIGSGRVKDEIIGVIRHEMVHCWQYNGQGTCPGGLIEGIADWIRLKAGLSPPHWNRGGKRWDDGYQNTAYFLDWCEEIIGKGFVPKFNAILKDRTYHPNIWKELSGGKTVKELWKEYKKAYDLDDPDGGDSDSEPDPGSGGEDHHATNIDSPNEDDDEQEKDNKHGNANEGDGVNVVCREETKEGIQSLQANKATTTTSELDEIETKIKEAIYICIGNELQKALLTKDKVPDESELTTAAKKSPSPDEEIPTGLINQNGISNLPVIAAEQPPTSLGLNVTGGTAGTIVDDSACGQSCASLEQTPIDRMDCTASDTSHSGLTSSNGSTRHGRRGSRTRRLSGSSISNSSFNFSDHDSGQETQIAIIARKRLAALEFHGDIEGQRFVKQFEALADRVVPEMSDDNRRVLLTACFKGDKVNEWYERLDSDDSMPYEELKTALTHGFKGFKAGKTLREVQDSYN